MSIAKWLLARKLGGGGSAPVIKRKTGNPIELTDAASAPMVKCVTQITGSQDLHGYDKPWAGGAGVNLCEPHITTDTTTNAIEINVLKDSAGNITGYNIPTATATAGTTIVLASFIPSESASYKISGCVITNPTSNKKLSLYDNTTGNDVVTIIQSDGIAYNLTASHTYYVILYVKNGTTISDSTVRPMIYSATKEPDTFSPYSNICPITAFDEGEVSVGGTQDSFYTTAGTEATNNNYTVTIIDDTSFRLYSDNERNYVSSRQTISRYNLTVGKTYYVRAYADRVKGNRIFICIRNSENKIIANDKSKDITPASSGWIDMIYTHVSDGYYLSFFGGWTSSKADVTFSNITFTEVTTHTTTFPTSIYRGSEDVVGGTVNADYVVITLNTANMNTNDDYPAWVNKGVRDIVGGGKNVTVNLPLNIGSTYGINTLGSNDILFLERRIYGKTSAEWKALALDVQIVLKKNSPTSPVTPTNLPIRTLSGYNHIESSTGDMTIDYITDAYQNFVNTVESALPNTRKGGTTAMDIFMTLDPDAKTEEEKPEEKSEEPSEEKR